MQEYKIYSYNKQRNALKPFLLYLVGIFILASGFVFAKVVFESWQTLGDFENSNNSVVPVQEVVVTEKKPVEPEIKSSVLLEVPFTVQAPYANWNIHEESCEEAGIMMAHYYFEGTKFPSNVIPKDKADAELNAMIAWQKTNYGSEDDLNMTRLGKLSKDYYGLNSEVKKDITETDIRKALSAGNPVIVPVMTHSLQNPNYGAQTTYHVLLIVGYDATGVIANDSGVSQGKGYHYNWDVVMAAIDAQKVKMGVGREMLILKK